MIGTVIAFAICLLIATMIIIRQSIKITSLESSLKTYVGLCERWSQINKLWLLQELNGTRPTREAIPYTGSREQMLDMELGTYLVVHKDGTQSASEFQPKGWKYDGDKIGWFYLPKLDLTCE